MSASGTLPPALAPKPRRKRKALADVAELSRLAELYLVTELLRLAALARKETTR